MLVTWFYFHRLHNVHKCQFDTVMRCVLVNARNWAEEPSPLNDMRLRVLRLIAAPAPAYLMKIKPCAIGVAHCPRVAKNRLELRSTDKVIANKPPTDAVRQNTWPCKFLHWPRSKNYKASFSTTVILIHTHRIYNKNTLLTSATSGKSQKYITPGLTGALRQKENKQIQFCSDLSAFQVK